MEIVEDYIGVANGCQQSLVAIEWPVGLEIMVVRRSLVSDKLQLAVCKLVYGRLMLFSRATGVSKIQAKVSSCKVVNYNEKRGGFGGRGTPSKCDERTEGMSMYYFTRYQSVS